MILLGSITQKKTQEGFTLLLELEGGDVAASSTETAGLGGEEMKFE